MAETVGYLDVTTRGSRSSFVSGGLTVYQPVDASTISGDGVLFDVKGDNVGWYYDSSTDAVYLINSVGDAVQLTRKRGLNSPVSQASTAAVTPGAITVGDTAADAAANVGIGEILVYDSVLSASNIERVVRALQNKWQATG